MENTNRRGGGHLGRRKQGCHFIQAIVCLSLSLSLLWPKRPLPLEFGRADGGWLSRAGKTHLANNGGFPPSPVTRGRVAGEPSLGSKAIADAAPLATQGGHIQSIRLEAQPNNSLSQELRLWLFSICSASSFLRSCHPRQGGSCGEGGCHAARAAGVNAAPVLWLGTETSLPDTMSQGGNSKDAGALAKLWLGGRRL